MIEQTIYNNVICARCKIRYSGIKSYTMAGAIRKATLECKGIIQTKEGPTKTICAAAFVRELDE